MLSFIVEAFFNGDHILKDRVVGMATKARETTKMAVVGRVMEYGALQKARFQSNFKSALDGRVQIFEKRAKR